ncbi:MAG TPA: mechanosensitive ion channel domain-containing protein [Dokdonella sp.]|uniref:mechanosensitive ion channel family protein n=1 Tax=Dokdonella sp. TaxID=2291710 RepID=UPI002D80D195|nr:mechanosensitive ion channel domain-containing protein [Dokdonella sp.]HET9033176.1 mechanosensitive ion channel domain-containing protein [Dokdonella sp.]
MSAVFERLLEESYRLIAALPMLLLALLIVWIAWWAGRWISRRAWIGRASKSNPFLQELARTTVRWIVLGIGLLVALEVMQATALVGAVLGTAGVLGVALGFAFKSILENYLAGILMSVRQPFAPRDHVVIDGNEGIVVSLTSRATILMTLDGNHLRLPNALVFGSVTLNYTRNPSRRFDFEVGIGVNEDLIRAQSLGVNELGRIDGVMDKPPPRALITALGDSNVQVRYHGWVDQREHEFLQVRSEAIRRVKLVLEEAGMDMPEPIYRVQMSEIGKSDAASQATQRQSPLAAAVEESVDTRATKDVEDQIDDEQRTHARNDLLDPAAPRE